MALLSGHRFQIEFDTAFPHGVFACKVQQAEDYNERTRRRTPAKDERTGLLIWTVSCIDRDPEARSNEVKIKVLAEHQPVLPGEIAPGTNLHPVVFSDLTVTPYVAEGAPGRRPQLAYSYRSTGMRALGKAPAAPAPGRGSGQAPSGGPGDGKAA